MRGKESLGTAEGERCKRRFETRPINDARGEDEAARWFWDSRGSQSQVCGKRCARGNVRLSVGPNDTIRPSRPRCACQGTKAVGSRAMESRAPRAGWKKPACRIRGRYRLCISVVCVCMCRRAESSRVEADADVTTRISQKDWKLCRASSNLPPLPDSSALVACHRRRCVALSQGKRTGGDLPKYLQKAGTRRKDDSKHAQHLLAKDAGQTTSFSLGVVVVEMSVKERESERLLGHVGRK